jgi:5'-nucleotidase
MQQRLAIDMDDVMADTAARFREYALHRLGKTIQPPDMHGRSWQQMSEDMQVPYQTLKGWLFEDSFFRGMQPMEGSQAVMKRLVEKYEVFIVSAAMEFPQSLREKLDWLNEYFPFISWRFVVFCGHKYMIQADFLIDDHERNLATFTGKPLLFSAHHNQHIQGYDRLENWQDIEKMFL